MVAVTELLFFIGMVLLTGLAVVGLLAVTGPGESERQRYARQAREAERQIVDIGRQAQAAILAEALKRARQPTQHNRGDQFGGSFRTPDRGHGEFRPREF